MLTLWCVHTQGCGGALDLRVRVHVVRARGTPSLHRSPYLTVSTGHSARLLTFHEKLPINRPWIRPAPQGDEVDRLLSRLLA